MLHFKVFENPILTFSVLDLCLFTSLSFSGKSLWTTPNFKRPAWSKSNLKIVSTHATFFSSTKPYRPILYTQCNYNNQDIKCVQTENGKPHRPFILQTWLLKSFSLSHTILLKCSYFASTSDLRYTVKVSVSSWGLRRLIFLSWSKSLRKMDKEFSCNKRIIMFSFDLYVWVMLHNFDICCRKKVKFPTSNRSDRQHEANDL